MKKLTVKSVKVSDPMDGSVGIGSSIVTDSLDPLSIFVLEQSNVNVTNPQNSSTVSHSINVEPAEDGCTPHLLTHSLKVVQPNNVKSKSPGSSSYDDRSGSKASVSEAGKRVSQVTSRDSIRSPDNGQDMQNEEKLFTDAEDSLHYLTGEQRTLSILDSLMLIPTGENLQGILFMTNYRLIFIPTMADLRLISQRIPSVHSYLQIPLACIDRIDRDRKPKEYLSNAQINIIIMCKDFRHYRITIRSNSSKPGSGENDIERALHVISTYAFPNNMRYLFAFNHRLTGLPERYHLLPYIPALEFSRLRVTDRPAWRISAANNSFKLCNTYPQWLVVPACISDDELSLVAGFRSGHRLPVLSWAHGENEATLWRSSQPKAGVSGSCSSDEKMLDAISRSTNSNAARSRYNAVIYIIDCRSRASAMANRAAGAGYESQTNYPSSKIDFYGICNIHAVRDSYKSLAALLVQGVANSSADLYFTKQVEDTQWLNNIRAILKASYDSAMYVHQGFPVLVHCSHGWDRTAQVCSIAQLFLDPHYRTFEGFHTLIEKEWISFGHPFQMRCAHSQDKQTRQDDEVAPIFLQFLDCVWQLLRQAPQCFEFNARYLLVVADHIYSGRFGTFLFSSDHDRDLYKAADLCPPIWTYLMENKGVLRNPLYSGDRVHLSMAWLPPLPQLLRNVSLWTDFFLRYSSVPSVPPIPTNLSPLLFRDGICIPSPEEESTNARCDFEIGTIATSSDHWEAMLRKERLHAVESEVKQRLLASKQQKMLSSLLDMVVEMRPEMSRAEVEKELDSRMALDESPTGGINTGDNSCWSTIQSDSPTPLNISPVSSPLCITVENDFTTCRDSVANSDRATRLARISTAVYDYDDLDSSEIYV